MLDSIINGFNWLVDTAQSIINFVMSLFEGFVSMIRMIPQIVTMVTGAIGYLPSVLAVFATLTITVSVLYLILGRNTGG